MYSIENSDFCTKFGPFSDPFPAKSPNSDLKRKFGPLWQQCLPSCLAVTVQTEGDSKGRNLLSFSAFAVFTNILADFAESIPIALNSGLGGLRDTQMDLEILEVDK